MQSLRACARRGLCAGVLSLAVFSYAAPVPVPVSVTQDDANFTLSNAWCTAKVSKRTGDLVSLKFKGIETMGFASGHHAGYWEQNPSSAANLSATVTIDPAANKGERGEVSVKGVGGRTPFDLEIRYTMGRDDHGVYTYAIFSHEPSYPAGQSARAGSAPSSTAMSSTGCRSTRSETGSCRRATTGHMALR